MTVRPALYSRIIIKDCHGAGICQSSSQNGGQNGSQNGGKVIVLLQIVIVRDGIPSRIMKIIRNILVSSWATNFRDNRECANRLVSPSSAIGEICQEE
jgi:hypothetical protein